MSGGSCVKRKLRRQASDARDAQAQKGQVSRRALAKLLLLPEYSQAQTVLWYVDCRSELRTRATLTKELTGEKRIAIPYCTTDVRGQPRLRLWLLKTLDELVVEKWGILEPSVAARKAAEREIRPRELDFAVIPGVAFDRCGGRLGHGQGYYDRLLPQVRTDCTLVGLCYECQLVQAIAMQQHDVAMDMVVTETNIYSGQHRARPGQHRARHRD